MRCTEWAMATHCVVVRRCWGTRVLQALASVRVPATVIQLITDLRTYLQEKVEPPVYISDRRLVKSIQLLQVCTGLFARVTHYL